MISEIDNPLSWPRPPRQRRCAASVHARTAAVVRSRTTYGMTAAASVSSFMQNEPNFGTPQDNANIFYGMDLNTMGIAGPEQKRTQSNPIQATGSVAVATGRFRRARWASGLSSSAPNKANLCRSWVENGGAVQKQGQFGEWVRGTRWPFYDRPAGRRKGPVSSLTPAASGLMMARSEYDLQPGFPLACSLVLPGTCDEPGHQGGCD